MPRPATLEELTAEVLRLKAQGVGGVRRVVAFGAGDLRDGEPPWTRAEIAAIVRNFNDLSTGEAPRLPVNIGLDHAQGGSFGGPSVGRVTAAWMEPGGVLCLTFADLPRLWADAVDRGLWPSLSVEVDGKPPHGLPGDGPTLIGVTLLGRLRPQIPWVSDLRGRVTHARRRVFSKPTPRGRRVFSEVFAMDQSTKDTLLAVIKGAFPDLPDEFLATLTDEQLQALATAATPAPPDGGDGATAESVAPAREEMIAAIVAADPSQDRAALEAMTDEDLTALWRQITGDMMSANATTPPAGTAPPATPPTTPRPAAAPAAPQAGDIPPVLAARFSALAAQAARIEAGHRRLEAEQARRERAERERTVKAYCAKWEAEGYVTPAEVDPKSTAPNLYHRLINANADRSRLYGAKAMNEFDAAVAEIEARGARFVRMFSERMAQTDGDGKTVFDRVRDEVRNRKAPDPGKSLHERLGRTPARV